MKIIHIVPGSGGSFYCQNCLRDNMLVKALRQLGHDVVVAPMYLPFSSDGPSAAERGPVFYGAVSLYLKQLFPVLRKAPRWCERLLNSRRMLDWAAKRAGSTRARGLEELTLSVLRGEDGDQAEELGELVSWLSREGAPDVVHLSNALLAGLARRIKTELHAPVVCTLQDEDSWLDAMAPEQARLAWDVLAERGRDVDAFVAVSQWYAGVMRDRMRIPQERLSVVHIGIDLEGREPAALDFDPPVLGFLSRMSPSLGLGTLVEAFIKLKKEAEFGNLKLRAAGGRTSEDRAYVRELQKRLATEGAAADAEFLPDFGRARRLEFLRSLSLLSTPVPGGEAFGTYLIEALAAGVPVVQPKAGAFPELLEATGGGIVYEPNDAAALAGAIASLLRDPERARELGRRGRQAVLDRFGVERMARDMITVYEGLTAS